MENMRKVRHELLESIRLNTDHFELLENLSGNLKQSSEKVNTICNEFDGISEARQELTPIVVEAFIQLQVVIYKLSMHQGEFDELLEKRMAELTEEYKKEENYSDMEF